MVDKKKSRSKNKRGVKQKNIIKKGLNRKERGEQKKRGVKQKKTEQKQAKKRKTKTESRCRPLQTVAPLPSLFAVCVVCARVRGALLLVELSLLGRVGGTRGRRCWAAFCMRVRGWVAWEGLRSVLSIVVGLRHATMTTKKKTL